MVPYILQPVMMLVAQLAHPPTIVLLPITRVPTLDISQRTSDHQLPHKQLTVMLLNCDYEVLLALGLLARDVLDFMAEAALTFDHCGLLGHEVVGDEVLAGEVDDLLCGEGEDWGAAYVG